MLRVPWFVCRANVLFLRLLMIYPTSPTPHCLARYHAILTFSYALPSLADAMPSRVLPCTQRVVQSDRRLEDIVAGPLATSRNDAVDAGAPPGLAFRPPIVSPTSTSTSLASSSKSRRPHLVVVKTIQ